MLYHSLVFKYTFIKVNSIFIGTRIEALQKFEELTSVIKIITVKDSYVHRERANSILVNKKNKEAINKKIYSSKAELVLSAGYPFILPANVLKTNKIFLNSHPSFLPFYKGRKCIKRAYENNEHNYGCTLHYMSEIVDSGKIIYQMKKSLKNYSLDEIYQYLFSECEAQVIEKGLKMVLNKV